MLFRTSSSLQPAGSARTIELEPGTVVALYIDGLTEATQNVCKGERRACEAYKSKDIVNTAVLKRSAQRPSSWDCPTPVAILTILANLFGPGPTPGS